MRNRVGGEREREREESGRKLGAVESERRETGKREFHSRYFEIWAKISIHLRFCLWNARAFDQCFSMSRLGYKNVVYHGDACLGELDTILVSDQNFQFPNNEIRIHHISPGSERCIPLSILHTISSFSLRCKLESLASVEQPHLINLHASCFYEFKVTLDHLRFNLFL